MTPKQKKFCVEYLKDLNATQAAIRAGYSEDTAYSIGNENLKKPEIKEFIDKQLEDVMNESKTVLKTRILKELRDISFTDDGIEITTDKDGNPVNVRMTDKLKAIELLGKYAAMFTEKLDVSGDLSVTIIDDVKGKR